MPSTKQLSRDVYRYLGELLKSPELPQNTRNVIKVFLNNNLRAQRLSMNNSAAKNSADTIMCLRKIMDRQKQPFTIITTQIPAKFNNQPDTICEYYFGWRDSLIPDQLAIPGIT